MKTIRSGPVRLHPMKIIADAAVYRSRKAGMAAFIAAWAITAGPVAAIADEYSAGPPAAEQQAMLVPAPLDTPQSAPLAANGLPLLAGWIEHVHIADAKTHLPAKLDSGATMSSIRAVVTEIAPDGQGEKIVHFTMETPDGEIIEMERPLIRTVRIKSKPGAPGQERPVVTMTFCIAGREMTDEVTLAPRPNFEYPVLIGRNMLRSGDIVINPGRRFIAPSPPCEAPRG